MDYKLIFETAMLAGEIMLRCGAEINRVEDTMNRMMAVSNLGTYESFVTPTGVILTLTGDKLWPMTAVKRVNHRQINLGKIELVNDVSRGICAGRMSFEEGWEKLQAIKSMEIYGGKTSALCFILACAFFTFSLEPGGVGFLAAAFNGAVTSYINYLSQRIDLNFIVRNLLSTFVVSVVTILIYRSGSMEIHIDNVIVGSIIPLMPGVALTNALRDTLHGDIMSGLARLAEALIVAASLAVGIGAGLAFLMGGAG